MTSNFGSQYAKNKMNNQPKFAKHKPLLNNNNGYNSEVVGSNMRKTTPVIKR